ncbi:hypothetical protein WMF38_37240 [Sorangium sp. So ce118]
MDGERCVDEGAAVRRELHAGWLAMSLLLGSTAATTSVRGEERPASGRSAESERDRVVRDFAEGRKAHVAGRLEEAEFFYLRAWARMKSYDIATNLGQVQLQLNKPASAAKHLAFGLRTVGPEIEPERLARMQALLAEAKAQVGTLRVRVKNVADAEVFVDGERVPAEEAKHELYLEPGPHVLVLRRAGYEEEVVRLMAGPGVTETITQELKPKAEKAPVAERAPVGRSAPAVGGADVSAGAKPKAPAAGAQVEQRAGGPRTAVITGGVVAAGVAAGIGTVLAVVAASKWSAASDQRDELTREGGVYACAAGQRTASCRDAVERYDDGSALWNAAIWSWIGAGTVGLGTAAYAWLAKEPPRRAGGVKVSPMLAVHGGGLVVTSAW